MITYIPWQCDGFYRGTIVQEGHTTFPIYPYFSYIFDPIPLLIGVQIQEGNLQSGLYASGASVWGLFIVHLSVVGGVWAPFIDAVPVLPI